MSESSPIDETGAGKSGAIGRVAQSLVPWVITVLIFVYIFRQVPVSGVREALELARFELLVPIILTIFVVFFSADVLAHQLAFRWLAAPTRFFEVLFARAATYILALVNFFIGQGGMGYWLVRTRGVTPGVATSAIFLVIFIELLMLMMVSAVGIVLMPEVHPSHFFTNTAQGRLVRIVFITLGVCTLLVLVWVRKPDGKLARRLFFRGPFTAFDRVRFRHFAILVGIKLFVFVFEVTGVWLALKTFGVDVPMVRVVAYIPLIYLIGAIPVTVLHLGTTQVAWMYFFRDLAPPATIVGFSLLWHLSFAAIHMLAGIACLPSVLKDLKRESTDPTQ